MIFKILKKYIDKISEDLFTNKSENLAFLVCNLIKTKKREIILVEKIIYPKKGILSKSDKHISYSPESYIDILEEYEEKDKIIIKIHNHYNNELEFSKTDDISDIEFSTVVRKFVYSEYVGSLIIGENRSIKIRFYNKSNMIITPDKTLIIGEYIQVLSEKTTSKNDGKDYAKDIFGDKNVEMMRSLRVGIVGLGGTGSAIFELLCRNYVGELVLIDYDLIEEKNISRLHESNIYDIGQPKAKHYAIKAKSINNDVVIDYLNCKANTREGRNILKDCDIIFGCLDKTSVTRVFLDMIKNAYLIPYFDLGLGIHTDNFGHLEGIYSRVSKIIPGNSCCFCNKIVNSYMLSSEVFKGTELDNEYLEDYTSRHDPQLISYNSLVANLGFNKFLEYLMNYGKKENEEPTSNFDLVSFEDLSLGLETPCLLCELDLGIGDLLDTSDYEIQCDPVFNKLNMFDKVRTVKDSDTYEMDYGVIYIERFKRKPIFANFLCPCGCGEKIRLGLTNEFYPEWKVKIKKNKVTVYPSIDAVDLPCKSHYIIEENRIIWTK